MSVSGECEMMRAADNVLIQEGGMCGGDVVIVGETSDGNVVKLI